MALTHGGGEAVADVGSAPVEIREQVQNPRVVGGIGVVVRRDGAVDRPQLVITWGNRDTTAPQTTIDSGPAASTSSTSATFTFSSSDSRTCSVDSPLQTTSAKYGPDRSGKTMPMASWLPWASERPRRLGR